MRGLTWDHPRGINPLRAASAAWEAIGGQGVSWEARSLTAFGDSSLSALAQDFDLLIIDHPHVGTAAQAACLLPLCDLLAPDVLTTLKAQSAGPSHASYEYGGKQWALAADAAVQVSSRRSDLIGTSEPTEWHDVPTFARELRSRGLQMAVPLVPGDCICCFLTLTASFGSPLASAEPFPTGTAGAVLDYLRELVAVAHPASLTWNPIRMYDAMSTSDDVAYCPLAFGYTNYSRDGFKPNRITFTNLPTPRRGLLGGAGVAVSRWASHPEEAARFAAWLCSAEVQRTTYCVADGQPGNRLAWTDPACNSLTHDFFTATLDTLTSAYVRPRSPGYVAWQVAAGNHINDFLRGHTTSAACLNSLTSTFDELVRDSRTDPI